MKNYHNLSERARSAAAVRRQKNADLNELLALDPSTPAMIKPELSERDEAILNEVGMLARSTPEGGKVAEKESAVNRTFDHNIKASGDHEDTRDRTPLRNRQSIHG